MNICEWIKVGKPWNVILHGDCMDLMKHFNDKEVSLSIVDPPYGIGINGFVGGGKCAPVKKYKNKGWDDVIPDKSYFKELQRISQNQIIWGGNYFIEHLYNTPCFIIWDKDNTGNFADCELAWASFKSAVRKIKIRWNGMLQENMKDKEIRIHETQKPIALYRWLLQNYAKPGDKIIDTHSGSGSLACACHLEKFDFLAIEKDEDYYNASVERLETLRSQGVLF